MSRPLAGRTILVTRPEHQAAVLAAAIEARGGRALRFPALETRAVPHAALATAAGQARTADDFVFVSPNAARYGLEALGTLPRGARVFAVGPGTARALSAAGIGDVQVPDGQDSEALLALPALAAMTGRRVVLVRGVGGRPLIAETLAARGAQVVLFECYRRVCPEADPAGILAEARAGRVDAITLASAETFDNLARLLGESGRAWLLQTPLFVPHEKIAQHIRETGAKTVIVTPGGDDGLVTGLVHWFSTHAHP